jgi:iron complex transport system ATP-binding protein
MSAAKISAKISAESVVVRLGGTLVVDALTLALKAGELAVLIGPNGAGKTTVARALAGLIPAEGRIAIEGRSLASLAQRDRARRIAYLPQGHAFHWPMTVAAVVALGRYPHGDVFSGVTDADRAAVERALIATDTQQFTTRSVTELSGGERARVALARALASEAPILMADEPTTSLDPRHQLAVMALLAKIAHGGTAVLVIVHDLALAARFGDRIARRLDEALGRLGVRAGEALFVGDRADIDVLGAQRVGMDAAWINPECAPLPAGVEPPRYEIRDLADLATILDV